MQSTSLRLPVLASLSIGTLLVSVCAAQQSTAAKPEGNNGRNAAQAPASAANAGRAPELEGLPSFLQVVPGGAVEMGLDADQFVNAACQALNPEKPAMAPKVAATKLGDAMKRAVSMLGRRKVNVETFLLAKWPVKCREYEVLLKKRRDAGTKMRPPMAWWQYGCKEDYEKRLPDIKREFPKQDNAHIKYWETHGGELPYALKDDQGKSIADKPVTTITWKDANEFAGWIGMRLPTESEWTRAARGDGTQVWPLATANPPVDAFTEQTLKQLKIYDRRDQVAKDVGTVAAASGPFGHLDMFGQVWQFIAETGYGPIHGADLFAAEWKKLQKDKVGSLLTAPPQWGDLAIAKGGSYLSTSDPIQLTIDARAPISVNDPLESLGFRLAKSLKPGYDMLYSLLRGTYNRAPFAPDQEIALAAQIGAERYELGADGFPTEYHAVSFAPVNWLSRDKNPDLAKVLERSQTVPMLIGTLVITEPLVEPAAPPGIYSVLYRREGIPRELSEALKTGHRELNSAAKAKGKGEESEAAEQGNDKKDKDKKESWRSIVSRFGLTMDDVASKDVADGTIKFVRVEGCEVPTDRDVFLLHDNAGKIAAVLPAEGYKPTQAAGAVPSKLVMETGDGNAATKGKTVCKFEVGAGLSQSTPKKLVELHFIVNVDMPLPAADKPWRLPK